MPITVARVAETTSVQMASRKRRRYKWRLAHKRRTKLKYDCVVLFSKLQKKTVGQELRSPEIKSSPCFSAFVSYSVGSRIRRRMQRNAENVVDTFFALVRFRLEERGYYCLVYSAHFLLDG